MSKDENTMRSPLHNFILRLFMNQTTVSIMTFFGIAIVLSFVVEGESTIEGSTVYFLLGSLLALFILAVISYSVAWRIGQREYNLVKYDHIRLDMRRGIKAGLFSQLPYFALGTTATIMYYAGMESAYLWMKIFYFPFWWLFRLHDRPYMFLISLMFVPLMANWGYRYGYAFISLRHKLVYQNPDKSEKRKSMDKRLR